MVAAPGAGINDYDGTVVKSELVDVECGENRVVQSAVAACCDPVPASADDVKFAQDEHGDSTECSSSSFGGSGFGSDDDTESDAGVTEVDSPFFSHINVGDTTTASHMIGKKNVSDDWRKFIGPERWRCHWLELRINDLLSQVANYDKELALVNHEKCLQLEVIKAGNRRSELSQLDLSNDERNTLNRRKRKRYEDYMDTSLYIKKHQVFSYYNYDNRMSRAVNEMSGSNNKVLDIDDSNNLDAEDTESSIDMNNTLLELNRNDTLEQYSLREILLSIECLQSRIINLRSYVDEAYKNVDHTQKSKKKKELHDLHQIKNAGRLFGEDGDGITTEMRFGVNNPLIDSHIKRMCKISVNDVLIDNEAVIEGVWEVEMVKRTDGTNLEPTNYAVESSTLVAELINKKGLQQNKKLESAQSKNGQIKRPKKENKETCLNYQNIGTNMFIDMDTRKSKRVRKPKIYLSK